MISLAVFGYALFDTLTYTEDIDLTMQLQVSDYVGFNIDTDAIYFGTVTPGGSSERIVTINNTEQYSTRVRILTGGDLAQWVSASENNFRINPLEERNITLKVKVPANTSYGNYTGIVKIRLKKIYI